ncbi:MAG TPA: hypothetical protein EYP63_06290 [Desulfotomaculum sp.]|nr:hypothetical protein [Desulfotomaculum sp.]
MPWYWRPLLGPVWIESAKGRVEREKPRRDAQETRAEPAETESKNTRAAKKDPSAGEAAREKPALTETPAPNDKTAAGEPDLCRTAAAIAKRFEEVAPGLFCFKTAGGTASHDKKRTNKLNRQLEEIAVRASGALCSSLDAYKMSSKTVNGLPIYTFKRSAEK